jgi:hypothetical protein
VWLLAASLAFVKQIRQETRSAEFVAVGVSG